MSFRGTVTILRQNPWMPRIFLIGTLGLVPLVATIALLPEPSRRTVAPLLIGGFVAGYTYLLSCALRPLRQTVAMVAGADGLVANGQCIAPRGEIHEAYVRPPIGGARAKGVTIPDWPLTVEIVSSRGQLNLDAGSEASAREIVAALGFPVTTCAPDHIAVRSPENVRWRRLGWIVVAGVSAALVALVALVAWMAGSNR